MKEVIKHLIQALSLGLGIKMPTDRLDILIERGLLSDFLEADPTQIDRWELQRLLNLPRPFLYGDDAIFISRDSADQSLPAVLQSVGLDITDYLSKRIEPVIYQTPHAIVRPVWFEEMGQAKSLIVEAQKYGWELADAFDAARYFHTIKDGPRLEFATIVAPKTKTERSRGEEFWFAINRAQSKAFWWPQSNINLTHGNGVQYLLRKDKSL